VEDFQLELLAACGRDLAIERLTCPIEHGQGIPAAQSQDMQRVMRFPAG
jgi:hypothetical protein